MTAVFYPDCDAESPNQQWKATAVSPHNGSIPSRDGSIPTSDFGYIYKQHQSNFRYQLMDSAGRIKWERWQSANEDSVAELLLADDGTLIIRTHGCNPELIAIRHDGQETIRVRVTGTFSGGAETDSTSMDDNSVVLDTMHFTTAGNYWTEHSWPYFLTTEGGLLFVWRTCTGQRIVIDPIRGRLIRTGTDEYAAKEPNFDDCESTSATTLLEELSAQKALIASCLKKDVDWKQLSIRMQEKVGRISAAALLAGWYRLKDCIPPLTLLQELDWTAHWTSSTGMRGYSIETQYLRPIIHHSLRKMNALPGPFPCYYFRNSTGRVAIQTPIKRQANDLRRLRPGMKSLSVLKAVGTPDHVSKTSEKKWKIYVWPETWDYDEYDGQSWHTTRLLWEQGVLANRLTSVTTMESPWLQSNVRIQEILGL